MLRYEAPLVYHLIRLLTPKTYFFEPSWEVVQTVCEASKDKVFRKAKFKRYMEEYRLCGVFCHRAKKLTPERLAYYEAMRRRKIAQFVAQNSKELQSIRAKKGDGLRRPLIDYIQELAKR